MHMPNRIIIALRIIVQVFDTEQNLELPTDFFLHAIDQIRAAWLTNFFESANSSLESGPPFSMGVCTINLKR